MKKFKKASVMSLFAAVLVFGASLTSLAQERPRVTKTLSSQPLNQPVIPSQNSKPPVLSSQSSSRPVRPTLTSEIALAESKPLIKKTSSSAPLNAAAGGLAAGRMVYSSIISSTIMRGITSRLGIPYLYGSSGPNRYDCSGFVWSVFRDAGISFERSSARTLWNASVPVEGDEKYKFGTLVFMNGLGHMGIVADENGFYHASSSKGITYSPFKGYWEKRITGFRRLPIAVTPPIAVSPTIE